MIHKFWPPKLLRQQRATHIRRDAQVARESLMRLRLRRIGVQVVQDAAILHAVLREIEAQGAYMGGDAGFGVVLEPCDAVAEVVVGGIVVDDSG